MIGFNPAVDKRQGRNHILTNNPKVAKCGKRKPEGFEPENPDAEMCGRCDPSWKPGKSTRITIPKGGWAKNGEYYRAGAQ